MSMIFWLSWFTVGITFTIFFGWIVANEADGGFKVKHLLLCILLGCVFGLVISSLIVTFIIVCIIIGIFHTPKVKNLFTKLKNFFNKKAF